MLRILITLNIYTHKYYILHIWFAAETLGVLFFATDSLSAASVCNSVCTAGALQFLYTCNATTMHHWHSKVYTPSEFIAKSSFSQISVPFKFIGRITFNSDDNRHYIPDTQKRCSASHSSSLSSLEVIRHLCCTVLCSCNGTSFSFRSKGFSSL